MNLVEQKRELRRRLRPLIRQAADDRTAAGKRICERLTASDEWSRSTAPLLFSPLPDEPDVAALIEIAIRDGKTACLPRYLAATGEYEAAVIRDPRTDLTPGYLGIPEPAAGCPLLPLNQLDLVVTPGVAFTADGARLGRGKGFYDRILRSTKAAKLGVGFDEQVVPEIPREAHDEVLNGVVTPAHWLTRPPPAGNS